MASIEYYPASTPFPVHAEYSRPWGRLAISQGVQDGVFNNFKTNPFPDTLCEEPAPFLMERYGWQVNLNRPQLDSAASVCGPVDVLVGTVKECKLANKEAPARWQCRVPIKYMPVQAGAALPWLRDMYVEHIAQIIAEGVPRSLHNRIPHFARDKDFARLDRLFGRVGAAAIGTAAMYEAVRGQPGYAALAVALGGAFLVGAKKLGRPSELPKVVASTPEQYKRAANILAYAAATDFILLYKTTPSNAFN